MDQKTDSKVPFQDPIETRKRFKYTKRSNTSTFLG